MKERRLASALDALEVEGTLEPAQRARVEERLRAELFPRIDASARFVAAITGLGGVLVAAGLFYFMASNWQERGRGLQLASVLVPLAGLFAGGWILGEEPGRYPRTGAALLLAAVIGIGPALFVIGQVYHVHGSGPLTLGLWWLLGLPVLAFSASLPMLYALLAVFLAWAYWTVGEWADGIDLSDGQVLLALTLVGPAAGAFLAGLGRWLAAGRFPRFLRFAPHLVGVALLIASTSFLPASFYELVDHLRMGPRRQSFLAALPLAVGLLAASLPIASARPRELEGLRIASACMGAGIVFWLAFVLSPVAGALAANLLILAGVVGAIGLGVREGRTGLVHFGLALFVAGLLCRYFEYIAGMLEGWPAFLVTGIVLLGVGFAVERGRRRLFRRMRRQAR